MKTIPFCDINFFRNAGFNVLFDVHTSSKSTKEDVLLCVNMFGVFSGPEITTPRITKRGSYMDKKGPLCDVITEFYFIVLYFLV